MRRCTLFLRTTLVAVGIAILWTGFTSQALTSDKQSTVPVMMLSDLHFDPFYDPGKVAGLRSAEIGVWAQILDGPASPDRESQFRALQDGCHARGVDTSWEVLSNSLQAAAKQERRPLFVTVSGDLLAHNFDCRARKLDPTVGSDELSAFAQKTFAFVLLQLHETYPNVPIYVALGNDDSGCANYHQSPGSAFLLSAEQSILTGNEIGPSRIGATQMFDWEGDYSAVLPAPLKNARLLVLQDVFEAPQYADCSGHPAEDASTAQLTWLRAQLEVARANHQRVWLMAHIPPGVDAYASFHKLTDSSGGLCSLTATVPMLRSDALSRMLSEFSDVVRLALFGHTHMDEIRLIHDASGHAVPVKIVPSISPVNGNAPAFTVAQVRPDTAVLADYTVYVAQDRGARAWDVEYAYTSAYGATDFSASSVARLTSSFAADQAGGQDASLTYQRWFFPGDGGEYARGLRRLWPAYACTSREQGGSSFQRCACPASEGDSKKPATSAGSP